MKLKHLLISLLLLAFITPATASKINNLRLWPAPDHLRLVFDLDAPVKHKIFSLDNPERVVIDLDNTQLATNFTHLNFDSTPLNNLRSAVKDQQHLRLVLDLKQKVQVRSFLLQPNNQYGHRLVVDLVLPEKQQQKHKKAERLAQDERKIVIALDPGHGGEDPGASGPARVKEKLVVFAIAKQLERILQQDPAYEVLLTRTGDYYVGLRQRVDLARKAQADLFISIHADAYRTSQPQGSSVYVLSERGATSESARWLASSENRADLIGGVEGKLSLNDKDATLAGVLVDLSMTATLTESVKVSSLVLKELGQINKLHKKDVEQAGFAVLKSLDMPSLLVEVGFISNPQEEARLKNPNYQHQVGQSLAKAIKAYFNANPPPNSYLAQHQAGAKPTAIHYKVQKGDSLSLIAQKHRVGLARIKQYNQLKSDVVKVGQIIKIPPK